MPHDLTLILTITGGLCAALVFGYLTQLLRLSPIVGYLLAGVAIGPFTPGYVAHAGIAEQLAELGVILLMFGVGLHFQLAELLAVRRVAIPGAILQIAVATGLGVLATGAMGWSTGAGVVFGLAISVASTVVLIRVLSDADALHTPTGHVAVGWLLVEDLFTVLVLVMLPVVAGGEKASAAEFAGSVLIAVVKIAFLVAFTFVVGRRVIPKLLASIARTRSRELFTLAVLAIALGIAVGSAKLFGASMALGAFLAGMVVGQSEFSSRAASDALPMRDAFAVLFFVSMGMLFDPRQLVPNLWLTVLTLLIVLLGKPLAAFVVVKVLRYPPRMAVAVALALAQIGEFSFILAALGRSLGILPAAATQALVATSILSITLNPILYRLVDPIARRLKFSRSVEPAPEASPAPDAHRAILVGYGPIGRTLVQLLREQDVEPSVIELNHETVRELTKAGIHAIYGDASQSTILEAAGIQQARALIFSSSTSADGAIREARRLNPDVLVIARSTYLREVQELRHAGADVVLAAEREVAFAMVEHVLDRLGATDDQIDRARDRARQELEPSV